MSASSKKKLRKEQEAAQMTEKQLAAQKEAKKLKLITTAFVAVMAVLLVIAIAVGVTNTIANSGIREKKTIALTVGDHQISNAELGYFYMDSVNNFYSQYGSYASMLGLDVTKPLNEQVINEETGLTWADDFLSSAKSNAQAVYALADAAKAAGYSLPEEELTALEESVNTIDMYANLYGYPDGDAYLKAFYGNGATMESYLEYTKLTSLASSYQQAYADSLVYEDADLRAAEAENFNAYSSYDYNSYYISASRFLTGGTTDEEGNTTYTDAEKAASVTAAEEAAKSLVEGEIASVEDFDAAIAALEVNKDTTASSVDNVGTKYASLASVYADWLTDSARKEGDMAYFANTSTNTAEDGTETTVTNGYYVVYYIGCDDNTFALANVRHILASFEHTHAEGEEHAEGETYSEEEMAAAKAEAEALLAEYEANATEENFAAIANEKSDDGDGTTGGLYEDIVPGQMVTAFNDWCFDEARKPGDTGIVETEYGYHVMYYVGDSDVTYRDYMIENDLRTEAVNEWYTATVDAMTVTDGDAKYINMALILNAN